MLLIDRRLAGAGGLRPSVARTSARCLPSAALTGSISKTSSDSCSSRRCERAGGNQTHAGQPARNQSGSGAVPHREVRAHAAAPERHSTVVDRSIFQRRPDASSPAVRLMPVTIGKRSVTTVPPPAGHDSVNDPPCSSAVRLAIGSPSPPPRAFVVKNGSKTCSRMSAGMPGPLSATSIDRCLVRHDGAHDDRPARSRSSPERR